MVIGCLALSQGQKEYMGGGEQGIYTLVCNMHKQQAKRGQCCQDNPWMVAGATV